jgi:hypothetical protein
MDMTISELRAEFGDSLEAFAARLGLKGKASAHEIEAKGKASVRVALEIERLSGGRIPADSLNDDIALTRSAKVA